MNKNTTIHVTAGILSQVVDMYNKGDRHTTVISICNLARNMRLITVNAQGKACGLDMDSKDLPFSMMDIVEYTEVTRYKVQEEDGSASSSSMDLLSALKAKSDMQNPQPIEVVTTVTYLF